MNYPDLPIMQCDAGCGECCGFAPCNEEEFQRIRDYCKNNEVVPKRQGSKCPLYQDGKCQVYLVRPWVCRLFGHTEKMECCKGYNTNVSQARVERMDRKYLSRGTPTRNTHELVFTESEIRMLFEHEIMK